MRKMLLCLLVAGFLAAGCAAFKVKKADELAAKGEWDEAVLSYADVSKKDPENIHYRIKYLRARVEAARIHHERGAEYLKEGKHDAALLEFQAALILDPSFKKAEEDLRKTKSQIDSIYHFGKGVEFLKDGKADEARISFQKSLKLNPENTAANAELEKIKKEKGVVIDGFELNLKSTKPITLEFKDVGVKMVFGVLSKLSGINFVFDSDVRDSKTTIHLKDSTFREALELLLITNNLSKKVVSENTVIIYPTNPQKVKQYEELVIKVFYLANIDAKKAVNLIKTMVKAKDIYVHDALNALVVRAEPSAIELARKILEATDLADAEVLLTVDVMEVNRNKAYNLGIDIPDTLTGNIPQGTFGAGASALAGIKIKDLVHLSSQDLIISIPSSILNMKVSDLDAEILANPRIRVKNREKAKIHIGDRVPIITTTANQGVTTESVQYQDVGLKLNVEPFVRPNDEIDLKISLEVSSLGTKTTTTTGSVVYQIGTRNAETSLRLMDGETQIIGGLINDEERNTVVKVPGLGEIPVIGRLFASTDKSKVKTDILLSITPHIIRRLEVPGEDVTRILSGKEGAPSLGPVMERAAPPIEEIPLGEEVSPPAEEVSPPAGEPAEEVPPSAGEPVEEVSPPPAEVPPPDEGISPQPGVEASPPPPPEPPGFYPPPPQEGPPSEEPAQ